MARLQLPLSLDQFLEGIISLFVTLQILTGRVHFLPVFAPGFFAAAFLASGLARGFAAGFAVFLAAGFFAGAFFFTGASSSPSVGAAITGFSRFGRGPIEGLLSL